MMAFIRKNTNTNGFTIVSNDIIKDNDLSWKARSILIYLLSLPDNWEVRLEEISKHSIDGYSSFRNGIKELEKYGYFKTEKTHDEGRLKYIYDISDVKYYFRFSKVENQEQKNNNRNSTLENQQLINTNKPNTNLINTNINKKQYKKDTDVLFDNYFQIFSNFTKGIKSQPRVDAMHAFAELSPEQRDKALIGANNYVTWYQNSGNVIQYSKNASVFLKDLIFIDYQEVPEDKSGYDPELGF